MGEGERKNRAKQFKQKEDEVAMTEFQEDDLLSARVAEAGTELDCELCEGSDFPALEATVLLIDRKRERVCVFLGAAQIGWVDPTGSDYLRREHRIAARRGRSLRAKVTDVAELSDRFTVTL
jgi:hypothetical protein